MAKKKFEEQPYNPLAADLLRDATLFTKPTPPQPAPRPPEPPQPASHSEPASAPNVLSLRQYQRQPAEASSLRGALVRGPTKRYNVTDEEDLELKGFVIDLQRASCTKVSLGLINRAGNAVLLRARREVIAEIEAGGPMRMPTNHDAVGYAEFEEQWARILERALRRKRGP